MNVISGIAATVLLLFPFPARAADFDGDSREDIAVFRPASGLWAVRGVTRFYFGRNGDFPRPHYYSGGNSIDIAVFRPSSGLWAIRDVTRVRFGRSGDLPREGDYSGGGSAEIAVFRETTGLWAVRGVTRAYCGRPGDLPIEGGVSQRLYDYVIKSGDGEDLALALENAGYRSVYVPKGSYPVESTIHVNGVELIAGAGAGNTRILLGANCHIFLETGEGVSVENISVRNGGDGNGQIQVSAAAGGSSFSNVDAYDSAGHGFYAFPGASGVSFVNCRAISSAADGFHGFNVDGGFANCLAQDCGGIGFASCGQLANCLADGAGRGAGGFYRCSQLANCSASGGLDGINDCHRITSCEAVGNTGNGFLDCSYVFASYAAGNGTDWNNCTVTAACNDR